MSQGTLLPDLSEVKLVCLRPKEGVIQMELLACRLFSVCPACGKVSHLVHSRYNRKLGDLPWEGLPVRIVLRTRRFSCTGETCRRRIFTELLLGTTSRYARRTGSPSGRPRLWIGSPLLWWTGGSSSGMSSWPADQRFNTASSASSSYTTDSCKSTAGTWGSTTARCFQEHLSPSSEYSIILWGRHAWPMTKLSRAASTISRVTSVLR